MKIIKIEIQHFDGCPNGPKMIDNVKEAMIGFGDKIDYKEIFVEDTETAARVGFRGSPTLLINGEDFENIPKPVNPGLTCRFYKNGIPTVEMIKEKLVANL